MVQTRRDSCGSRPGGPSSQPGAISHIVSESGPMYSRTAWASSQLAGATTTGPLCPLTAPPRLSQTCISRCKTESPRRPQPCTRRRMTVRCFTITHLSSQGWWRLQLTTGGSTTTTAFPWSATARSVWPRLNAPSPSTGGSPTRPAPLRPHLHRPCARTGPCTGTPSAPAKGSIRAATPGSLFIVTSALSARLIPTVR